MTTDLTSDHLYANTAQCLCMNLNDYMCNAKAKYSIYNLNVLIQLSCNKMPINYLKIIQCDFLDFFYIFYIPSLTVEVYL